jgi:hypothetical protein
MDETDPLALAQYQLRNEMKLVWRYGRQEAPEQFGGCYWDNEPPVTIVALFTAEVDRHRTVLHGRLMHPDRLVIRLRGRRGSRSKPTTARSPTRSCQGPAWASTG